MITGGVLVKSMSAFSLVSPLSTGLSSHSAKIVMKWCRCVYKRYPFQRYPSFQKKVMVAHAWKVAMIRDALKYAVHFCFHCLVRALAPEKILPRSIFYAFFVLQDVLLCCKEGRYGTTFCCI